MIWNWTKRSNIGHIGQKGQFSKIIRNCLKNVENQYFNPKTCFRCLFQHLKAFSLWTAQDLENFSWTLIFSKSTDILPMKVKKWQNHGLETFFLWNIDFAHVSDNFRHFLNFDLFDLSDLFDLIQVEIFVKLFFGGL